MMSSLKVRVAVDQHGHFIWAMQGPYIVRHDLISFIYRLLLEFSQDAIYTLFLKAYHLASD